MKKSIIIVLNLVILGGAAWFGYQKYQDYFNNPWTRDGQVRANIIKVAPRVSGPIVNVAITDNQRVQEGDLLFEIDPETYQVALAQVVVYLEAIVGVFYMAIVVSSLVSANLQHREKQNG